MPSLREKGQKSHNKTKILKSGKMRKITKSKKTSKNEEKSKTDRVSENSKKLKRLIADFKSKEEENKNLNNTKESDDEPSKEDNNEEEESNPVDKTTFHDLGLLPQLCEAAEAMKFKHPTPIQSQAIPFALEGRDIIGLAQTGSGKTAAFALPILDALWKEPSRCFACVLSPTRELAVQITEQFEALGSNMGVKVATLLGGMNKVDQALALARGPHIIVATPGRLVDHLESTKGFSLGKLKYLVMDEADRLLDMDFGKEINTILKIIPPERHTYLFSATMTTKVLTLQRACLKNPVKVAANVENTTVATLDQKIIFRPFAEKDFILIYLLNEFLGNLTIIFARTCNDVQRIAILCRTLGFHAVPLHGQLSQSARLGALNRFKSGTRSILVATDVAARGLDIPHVDLVLNYDIPTDTKSYIHRVGRTARAGRSGRALTLVSQYDLDLLLAVENTLDKKLELYDINQDHVALLHERVSEAQRMAIREMKDVQAKQKTRNNNGFRGRRGKNDREEQ